ncbi:molybdate transport system substrate-binding protein [Rhodobacter aestuarii]|uniref:Molybdate transport system substrate-binding protein n=1 Tax=Rhodobacter aestuarii TaxID=453582 RepID=A0A1N7NTZ7_9RHOB|nr:molybdate ABC transporter substrate-binding protein [Rhodobacter aestuarii]PTV94555.1 molybdate transport system substrate-binding protein [Rhodobacter aestuarii]SIT01746.1 molybdate transport system substrate-binding protein [Rhodobacter aestuarii]
MIARLPRLLTALPALLALTAPVQADEVMAAVAANFTKPAQEIAALFTAETGHEVTLSFGPSGQFYTQITQGAPFEVFLSADAARPTKAIEEGFGVPGSAFTYAQGKLVLWSTDPNTVTGPEALQAAPEHVAIADPSSAPYGAAAMEVLAALGLSDALKDKIITGKSIAQAYQFTASGNAPLGFVAMSQVAGDTSGSSWVVPADLYSPIKQDAVLLTPGANDPAAQAFLDFLKTEAATAIIVKYGYETGE